MPAAIDPAIKEAVKASVITHGVRPTAAAFNLPLATVGTWSSEEGWCRPVAATVPATMLPSNGSNVKPSAAASSLMGNLGDKSKLKLAKATMKGAAKLASMHGGEILDRTGALKDLAATGKILHSWGDSQPAALVNITIGPAATSGPVIDITPEQV